VAELSAKIANVEIMSTVEVQTISGAIWEKQREERNIS
jgi:hypothetical protein